MISDYSSRPPTSEMGKKRKVQGSSLGHEAKVYGGDEDSYKLSISNYEDVANSEDDFLVNRDKILLHEEPEAKKLQRLREQDEFLNPSDEEVLRYSSDVSYSSYTSKAQDDEESDFDNFESETYETDKYDHKNELSHGIVQEKDSEDEEGWGPSRHIYYDADRIETEQDALDEEQEALRIQRKHLQSLDKSDYGLDEEQWKEKDTRDTPDENGEGGGLGMSTEILPLKQVTEDMSPNERLDILNRRYPEFEPLSQEFTALQKLHKTISTQISRLKESEIYQHKGVGSSIIIKQHALTAYLASLTLYFAILSTPLATGGSGTTIIAPADLRVHPIMDSLYRCRKLWENVRQYQTDDKENVPEDEPDARPGQLERDEAKDLKMPAPAPIKNRDKNRRNKSRHNDKLQTQLHAQARSRLAEKTLELEEELKELDTLAARAKQPDKPIMKAGKRVSDEGNFSASDLGEETDITPYEAAEKANKRKRLRFYTSQIAQRANRRDMAGRGAGGDMDIPHRERLRDRSARLTAEASARARSKVKDKADLGGDDDEINESDAASALVHVKQSYGDDTDYYDKIAQRSEERKKEKNRIFNAMTGAEQANEGRVVQTDDFDPIDKRAVTYAMEKNKGLTPRRKKEVRNPRVKKRKRFEDKKKKLGSMKSLYKGGEGKGGYRGELTGIKTDVVKSIKL